MKEEIILIVSITLSKLTKMQIKVKYLRLKCIDLNNNVKCKLDLFT